ncbi:hypothetical protein GCM10010520_05680 [Rhizobium viscosum]
MSIHQRYRAANEKGEKRRKSGVLEDAKGAAVAVCRDRIEEGDGRGDRDRDQAGTHSENYHFSFLVDVMSGSLNRLYNIELARAL